MGRAGDIAVVQEVHATHTVIHPADTLREKALTRLDGPDLEQDALIARADEAVERLAPNFEAWLRDDVDGMRRALDAFGTSARDEAAIEALRVKAQALRGSCRQFGYELAADVAGQLTALLEDGAARPVPVPVLVQFVDAISSIVRGRVQDTSDFLTAELVRALRELALNVRRGRRDI